MTMSRFAVALSAAVAVGSLAFIANPAAAATAMADCNKQWNDIKTANKTNGATYQDFLKTCLKAAPAADAKATDAKATDAKATDAKAAADKTAADAKAAEVKAKDAKTKVVPVATVADAAADPAAAAKKECGKQWKALKDAGTQGTQKKKDFVSACLTKAGVAPDKTDAKVADPKAKDAMAKDVKATDAKVADEPTPPEPAAALCGSLSGWTITPLLFAGLSGLVRPD